MTTRFGRTTPSQMFMLSLAGIDYSISLVEVQPSDEERMKMMTAGRKLLQKLTGKDFGFDLANWRDFLMASDEIDEFGYKHPYAFEQVDEAIQLAILDTKRKRIIATREKRAIELLNMLMNSPHISVSSKSNDNVLETSGVYQIVESDTSQRKSIYVGRSKNIHSQVKGKSIKSILERISKEKGFDSFAVQFVSMNEAEADWFVEYAIEKLMPFVYESPPV